MPADHLRALIEAKAPGRSVRDLTAAAGVPENRLAYWLKPGTTLTRMPTLSQLRDIAGIIGCATDEVYLAIQRDLDPQAEFVGGLTDDERALLATYRRLQGQERERLHRIAEILGS